MEVKMRPTLFQIGWILILLATIAVVCVNKEANIWPGTVFCVGLFALSTYCLFRNADFPYRSKALANSWVGPLLIATSEIVFSFYFHRLQTITNTESIPPLATSILDLKHTMIALLLLALLSACVEALFVTWLFFGYGLIHIMALIAYIPLKRTKQNRDKGIGKYPLRWTWFFVVGIFLLGILRAVVIAWIYFDILHTLR